MTESANTEGPADLGPGDYRSMFRALERSLLGMRDEAQQDIETYPIMADYWKAQLSAFQRVVGVLNIVTEGAYGQSYTDQTEGQK